MSWNRQKTHVDDHAPANPYHNANGGTSPSDVSRLHPGPRLRALPRCLEGGWTIPWRWEEHETERGPMIRRHIVRAIFSVPILATTSLGVVPPSSGQAGALDEGDMNVAYEELGNHIGSLEGAIADAEHALAVIKKMPLDAQGAEANVLFSELEVRLNSTLDGLGPNSVLKDNLEGATSKVTVLKRWFERQPASYPNRDQQIARLHDTVTEYHELSKLIEERRSDTQEAWKDLARAMFVASMELKVQVAENSVGFLGALVEKLGDLSTQIRIVADKETPNAESPEPTSK